MLCRLCLLKIFESFPLNFRIHLAESNQLTQIILDLQKRTTRDSIIVVDKVRHFVFGTVQLVETWLTSQTRNWQRLWNLVTFQIIKIQALGTAWTFLGLWLEHCDYHFTGWLTQWAWKSRKIIEFRVSWMSQTKNRRSTYLYSHFLILW